MLSRFARLILFGNYYLAFCIVALSVETSVKNGFFITDPFYYLLLFFSVVLYYTHAYIGSIKKVQNDNERSLWYYRHRKFIFATQVMYTLAIGFLCLYLFFTYQPHIHTLDVSDWGLLILFPLLAVLYYNVIFPARFRFTLRSLPWLKPFVIGFVCTGLITVYPFLFHAVQKDTPFRITRAECFYFLTNWLYTTVIAIMFDIKDFVADHNYRLKTFVVTKGLRRTISFILLPLAVASFGSFFMFASSKHFSLLQILINIIPFMLLLVAAFSMRRRKNILYYLVVIDGLLLVKAAFGIAAMLLAE